MLKINEVLDVLKNAKVPDVTLKIVAQQLKEREELKNDNKDHSIKAKKKFILLSDTKDTGFALQLEESESDESVLDKVNAAISAYNNSKKGQKFPVKSVSEGLKTLPRKFLVNAGVWVKTKESVRLINL